MSEPVPIREIMPEVMSNIRKRMHHNNSQKKPRRRIRGAGRLRCESENPVCMSGAASTFYRAS